MTGVNFRYVIAIAGVTVLALAGCAQEPSAAPSAHATPKATATPAAAREPSSSRDLACSDLGSVAQATALAAQPVTAVDPALYENLDSRSVADGVVTERGMLPSFTVQQSGGLTCEWSNGSYRDASSGSGTSEYAGLRVQLLFDQQGTHPYGADESTPACDPLGSECWFNQVLDDGTWLVVSLQLPWKQSSAPPRPDAAATLTAFTTAVTGMKSAIAAAPPSGATWSPAGTLPLPAECAKMITPAQVKAALGLPYDLMTSHGDGYATVEAVSQQKNGDSCSWTSATDDHDGYVGGLSFLRGGAWAWHRLRDLPSVLGPRQSLAVPGLKSGDEAWVHCDAPHTSCTADLVVGGNWLELSLAKSAVTGYGAPTVDRLAAITTLATEAVATIRR